MCGFIGGRNAAPSKSAPPPPKPGAKSKADPSPSPPPPKPDPASPEFTTSSGSAPGPGASTPKTISLKKYHELVAHFNQLQEALVKVRKRKDHHKNESVSLSGSLSDNAG